jgi:hypothetical protein
VQPGESFGSADRDDEPVGTVDDRRGTFGAALFAEWIAVMPGDAGVGRAFGRRNRARGREEWTG